MLFLPGTTTLSRYRAFIDSRPIKTFLHVLPPDLSCSWSHLLSTSSFCSQAAVVEWFESFCAILLPNCGAIFRVAIDRSEISSYSLKNCQGKLALPLLCTNFPWNSFSHNGTLLWNSLPVKLRQAQTLASLNPVPAVSSSTCK